VEPSSSMKSPAAGETSYATVEPSTAAMKSPSASVATATSLGKDGPWQPTERHKRDDHAENP